MGMALESMEQQEKLTYILSELASGRDREELALSLGYKSYKTMDGFVRRQGYTWDRHLGNYLLPSERRNGRYALIDDGVTGKPGEIIRLFAKKQLDAKEVAQQAGFHGHRDLAHYMKLKGYTWDAEIQNYRLEKQAADSLENQGAIDQEIQAESPHQTSPVGLQADDQGNRQTAELTLLDYLVQKEDVLRKLLEREEAMETDGIIPRFAVPGVFITKSVHMTNQLDQLIKDFSNEKNIRQRELFEVALLEFFQKYGYKKEVDVLLQVR